MEFAHQVLIHTPIWVFALLAYLVWQGISAMRPRTTTMWRSLLVPAVFIIWGLSRLLSDQQAGSGGLLSWILSASVLAPIGYAAAKPFKLDRATGQITRPGSVLPLIRNVSVFALQYAVAVTTAVDPSGSTLASLMGRAVSGATTGYFLGRTIAQLRQYIRERRADPMTSPPPP
jgi:uncharacterized protein DUF6622